MKCKYLKNKPFIPALSSTPEISGYKQLNCNVNDKTITMEYLYHFYA